METEDTALHPTRSTSNHDQHSSCAGRLNVATATAWARRTSMDAFDQVCSNDEELLRALEEAEVKKVPGSRIRMEHTPGSSGLALRAHESKPTNTFDQVCSTDEELLRALEETERKRVDGQGSKIRFEQTNHDSAGVGTTSGRGCDQARDYEEESRKVHIVSQQDSEGEILSAMASPAKRKHGLSSALWPEMSQEDSVVSTPDGWTESPFKRLRRAVQAVTPSPSASQRKEITPRGSATNEGESIASLRSTERVRLAYADIRPRSLIASFSEGIDDCNSGDEAVQDSKEREMLKMWMNSLCRKIEEYLRKLYKGQNISVSTKYSLKELIEFGRKVPVPLPFIEVMHEIRFLGEIAKYDGSSFPSKAEVESKVKTYQNAKRGFDAKMIAMSTGRPSQFL